MRYSKWLGLAAAVLLVVSCFSPWVIIESRQLTVSGVDSTGTNFGKPAYFHFFLTFFYVICLLVPRLWAKRLNLVVAALNMGWALRNSILLPACQAGDCPVKQTGLWMAELAAIFMLLAAVFPDMKLPVDKQNS